MNAHQDHPNDGVEDQRGAANGAWPLDQARTNELESEALDALARSWQTAPPLQVDPTFAAHLERRLLAHRTAPQRRHAVSWRARRWMRSRAPGKRLHRFRWIPPLLLISSGGCWRTAPRPRGGMLRAGGGSFQGPGARV